VPLSDRSDKDTVLAMDLTNINVKALLKPSGPRRRFRKQSGTIVERSDGFYLRFYKDGDGGTRTKVTERLCDLTVLDAKKRELLAASHLSTVNNLRHAALRSQTEAPALTIEAFWNDTYLPWVKENKRFSTARGYEYDWKLYVKDQIATKTLIEFTTVHACALLDHCASVKKLSKRSLAHVKSLCSGIFSHAVRKGHIQFNPWREARATVRVRASQPRIEYTPEETITILDAIESTDAKLFFGLVAVMGMRPSEAAATKWENIDLKRGVLKVREAAPYGVLGGLKTEKSKGDILITEPVTSLLKTVHKERGNPSAGLLFTHDGATPINHNTFAKTYITPFARKVCSRWNGCYSGRHGAATTLYNLTGDVRAAYQVLRNSLAVVQKEYIKPSVEQGQAGQLQYAQILRKVMKKTKKH
jgi:integrase